MASLHAEAESEMDRPCVVGLQRFRGNLRNFTCAARFRTFYFVGTWHTRTDRQTDTPWARRADVLLHVAIWVNTTRCISPRWRGPSCGRSPSPHPCSPHVMCSVPSSLTGGQPSQLRQRVPAPRQPPEQQVLLHFLLQSIVSQNVE